MILYIKNILWCSLLLVFASCDINNPLEVCEYNARIIYRYNRENTTYNNVLPQYIHSLTEYIFDERYILYAINTLPGTSCFGEYISEINLPPGRYTVITWGNKATQSKVNKEQIGVTKKQEMMLYLDNPYTADPTLQSDSERLYYGYRTFTINEFGMSLVNVDMFHSHCVLNITVRWKRDNERPAQTSSFHMTQQQIPFRYQFTPEAVEGPEIPFRPYTLAEDTYLANEARIKHYIPFELWNEPPVNHYNPMRMDAGKQLRGQFVTYRYRTNGHELLTIYIDNKPLANKSIDLYTFFKAMQIDLDKSLRQEYDLLLEIDGDQITASLMTDIDDWNEGGVL